jgi:hypothetical protein
MDTIGKLSMFGSWILFPIVFACAFWRLRRLSLARRFLTSVLFSGALFLSLQILAWSICLRDGLGPDSMGESYGMEAFARCWTGLALAFVVGAVLLAFGILLARPSKKTVN